MTGNRGFTLIELILAAMIMTMIGTFVYSSLFATFKTEQTLAEKTVLQEEGTAILSKIQDDVSQIFLVEAPGELTYFQGKASTDQSKMSFTSMSHIRSGPNTHESDQAEITYETETDPKSGGYLRLIRRENKYLSNDHNQQGDSIVLTDHLTQFQLAFNDGERDQSSWDSRTTDQKDKLPKLVKVSFTLKDEKEREGDYEATIELPLTELIGVQMQASPTPTPTPGQNP